MKQYPFSHMLERQRRELKELERATRTSIVSSTDLGKRPMSSLKRGDSLDSEDSSDENSLEEDMSEGSKRLATGMKHIPMVEKYKTPAKCDKKEIRKLWQPLKEQEAKTFEGFLGDISDLIDKVYRRDDKDQTREEDLLILVTMKEIAMRYFIKERREQPSVLASCLREMIKVGEMVDVMATVKFRDKLPDMIIVHVRQYIDNIIDLILNPETFARNKSDLARPGKSLINMFILVVRTLFEQVKTLKSLCSERANLTETGLFQSEQAQELVQAVNLTLDIFAFNPNTFDQHSVHQNSGFEINYDTKSKQRKPSLESEPNKLQKENNDQPKLEAASFNMSKEGSCKIDH